MSAPHKTLLLVVVCLLFTPTVTAVGGQVPIVSDVELQPLQAQAKRVAEALQYLGAPLSAEASEALARALANTDQATATREIQEVFDPLCLALVNINPESRVKVAAGPAAAKLMEQGWRVFLVKIHNEAGVTSALRCTSPNAAALYARSSGSPDPKREIEPGDVLHRWLDVSMFDRQPLSPRLSGLALEYRVLELFSRDAGQREAKLQFDVGQGTQDLGFRNELSVLFDCRPATNVTLEVFDDHGGPSTAQFVITDALGRVYPSRARRLEPDFFFHDQIYRHHGEAVLLPPGQYDLMWTRGPEYTKQRRQITVPEQQEHQERFWLRRWIKMSDYGWYSGDHHVHAAGCAHYEAPTQGVTPAAMMRHILGEDLNVGCVLSWGPCWYAQKEYFEGKVHELSTADYKMRYDVEVSGFPSSHAGHLCLLRLKEDDYPGTTRIEQWPSWDLPVLRWGKEQGGVVGFSHSGWGLDVESTELPNLEMPKFSGIGANEYIVDVTHGVCDFISAVDTPIIWELNIWYHTLNCGYTCRISGETDFPCIYGDRVGLGRVYVKLDGDQPLNFDRWVEGLRDGRSYCCDGLSHLFDFKVNELGVGEVGDANRHGFLATKSGQELKVTVRAAALLEENPREDIRGRPLHEKPYWHVERARIGQSRSVPVELVVNGRAVARRDILADGTVHKLEFQYTPEQSGWVALRIFPSCHTNPIFVEVDGKPIRASKQSAQWCLDAVDVCWQSKLPAIRAEERDQAAEAYEHARQAYRKVLAETTAE
jgi:hypothetical protein